MMMDEETFRIPEREFHRMPGNRPILLGYMAWRDRMISAGCIIETSRDQSNRDIIATAHPDEGDAAK